MNTYDQLLKTMPVGLERAILRVLQNRVGKSAAIGRGDLVAQVHQLGVDGKERQVREIIKELRRDGHLICSLSGEDGGYYLAGNRAEFEEFMDREYNAKITDMAETARRLNDAAKRQFGEGVQMGLGI